MSDKYRDMIMGHALSKKKAVSSFPFDDTTEVFKVSGRIFMLVNNEEPFEISLKCDPQRAVELRSMFGFIRPGYHLNKKHWITVVVDGSMGIGFYEELIDHSYLQVVNKLTRAERDELRDTE
ncbi:MmcQ/YjbR family DNA-binding protein [Youngiibacter multivorans]|uniref:DNA-binding protein (MmcQ/YjbR family) n=1 Tax=Youngiibacter multivorans TaxID=937251 RepID=A0ABS4G8P7_9CLOT|nr:MmcQ/YjbR family DNA-binding protein [Youngiibacter multivorans]MBP1920937.1 putative DNA-binding protein (MmcQ/YjbR family) [Youngiibacter multivorans]